MLVCFLIMSRVIELRLPTPQCMNAQCERISGQATRNVCFCSLYARALENDHIASRQGAYPGAKLMRTLYIGVSREYLSAVIE